MKKIVVLCCSGRKNGNSEKLADAFIKGAEQNNKITKFVLADKNIKPCQNCDHCQSHQGECAIKDDMTEILSALQENELLVISSPVYYLNLTAQFKTVIDRTYAESAVGRKIKNAILLTVSGKKEVMMTDLVTESYHQLCNYLGYQDLGVIAANGFVAPKDIEESELLADAFKLGQSIL